MAIYLEIPKLDPAFPFRILVNEGDILTTPHWHKEIEIILIRSGIVNLGVSDDPIQAKANDIIIIGSGEIHYVLASAQSERLVFQFDFSFFQELTILKNTEYSLYELFASIQNNSQLWSEKLHTEVIELLEKIYEEYCAQEEGYVYAIKGYLCMLVTLLYRNLKDSKKQEQNHMDISSNRTLEMMDQIFRYVEDHYNENMMLEDVADAVGFSTYYFTKFFKKNTGKTFITFLNEYRVEKAKWILLNEDISVNELIERTGFGSSKTFYRVFKQVTGVAPSIFKQEHLQ